MPLVFLGLVLSLLSLCGCEDSGEEGWFNSAASWIKRKTVGTGEPPPPLEESLSILVYGSPEAIEALSARFEGFKLSAQFAALGAVVDAGISQSEDALRRGVSYLGCVDNLRRDIGLAVLSSIVGLPGVRPEQKPALMIAGTVCTKVYGKNVLDLAAQIMDGMKRVYMSFVRECEAYLPFRLHPNSVYVPLFLVVSVLGLICCLPGCLGVSGLLGLVCYLPSCLGVSLLGLVCYLRSCCCGRRKRRPLRHRAAESIHICGHNDDGLRGQRQQRPINPTPRQRQPRQQYRPMGHKSSWLHPAATAPPSAPPRPKAASAAAAAAAIIRRCSHSSAPSRPSRGSSIPSKSGGVLSASLSGGRMKYEPDRPVGRRIRPPPLPLPKFPPGFQPAPVSVPEVFKKRRTGRKKKKKPKREARGGEEEEELSSILPTDGHSKKRKRPVSVTVTRDEHEPPAKRVKNSNDDGNDDDEEEKEEKEEEDLGDTKYAMKRRSPQKGGEIDE